MRGDMRADEGEYSDYGCEVLEQHCDKRVKEKEEIESERKMKEDRRTGGLSLQSFEVWIGSRRDVVKYRARGL